MEDTAYWAAKKTADTMNVQLMAIDDRLNVSTYRDGEWRLTRKGFYLSKRFSSFGASVVYSCRSQEEMESFITTMQKEL